MVNTLVDFQLYALPLLKERGPPGPRRMLDVANDSPKVGGSVGRGPLMVREPGGGRFTPLPKQDGMEEVCSLLAYYTLSPGGPPTL